MFFLGMLSSQGTIAIEGMDRNGSFGFYNHRIEVTSCETSDRIGDFRVKLRLLLIYIRRDRYDVVRCRDPTHKRYSRSQRLGGPPPDVTTGLDAGAFLWYSTMLVEG